MKNIPFSPPDISEAEIEEVAAALRSGWITTGPRVKELEIRLAEYCHVPRMVCLNSATAAEELTLRLLGIGPGDEVIVPAYTYTATAAAAIHVGAKVIFIDSQKDSVEMDYDLVEEAVTPCTKAIIPVDLAGIPCNYAKLLDIACGKRSLFCPQNHIQEAIGRVAIVADSAHALGAEKNGCMVGSIADFSSFSFHAVKNFTTGEGGAVAWKPIKGIDDEEIYRQFQLLSLHGQSKDALAKTKLGAWEYDIIGPWYKCNMTDIMGAIGLKQLERYPKLLARRKAIISQYDAALRPLGIITLPHFADQLKSSGHLYLTRIPGISEKKRNNLICAMAEMGIACNVHYKPLPMMTAYKSLGWNIQNFPNAYALYANEITLPLHTKLSDDDVEYVVECFKKAVTF